MTTPTVRSKDEIPDADYKKMVLTLMDKQASREVATAEVWMKADLDHAYERYLASEESLGKAGAYAIQGLGAGLVERIAGDYTTVVGLPLKLVAHLLRSAGYPLLVNVEGLYRRKPYANWNWFAS